MLVVACVAARLGVGIKRASLHSVRLTTTLHRAGITVRADNRRAWIVIAPGASLTACRVAEAGLPILVVNRTNARRGRSYTGTVISTNVVAGCWLDHSRTAKGSLSSITSGTATVADVTATCGLSLGLAVPREATSSGSATVVSGSGSAFKGSLVV